MNAAFGIPVWADDDLWDDDVATAAARLSWPQESQTSTDSSFRKYPKPVDRVLGARPYSLALYGENGLASRLSLMFANKGDAGETDPVAGDAKAARDMKKQVREFAETMKKDAATISAALTALLGPPSVDKFGQGSQTRESVQRWDWNGHAILLASPRDEYVALRILPPDVADAQGKARISDAELRERLLSRVEKRPNGDVILNDIPMVDQGPKGYCVPATWERVMRYMAIPADMYVLAMAGDTAAGGGTSISAIVSGVRESVMRGGRRLDPENGKISVRTVEKYINRGLPLMWAMYSMNAVNADLNSRMDARSAMTDPLEWRKSLEPARKAAKKIPTDVKQAHMCMIIGYNEKTGEIAVSDSWGPRFAERWMTEEEANAVSQGQLMAINF
ncbi:MAG: hypothetical protein NTV93_19935 [Verrucomicrobia bacterium]|nr:hypothetical protein [Verrucomicrobiota bacterium]